MSIHLPLLIAGLLLCPDGATPPAPTPTATAKAAPAKPAEPLTDASPVVVIDGKTFNRGEYKEFLIDQFGAGYLDVFVTNKLILSAAQAQGLTPTAADLAAWIEEKIVQAGTMDDLRGLDPETLRKQYAPHARTMFAIEAMVKRKRLSEEGIKHEYDLLYGEKRRGRHILIRVGVEGPMEPSKEALAEGKKKADEIRAALVKGADFAEVAKRESADPGSAQNGGDLGEFDASSPLVPEFLDAAMKLKKDEISEPVKTEFGWHIIQVTKLEPPARAFDDAMKAEIREKASKRPIEQNEAGRIVKDLREAAKVEKKIE